MPGFGRSAHPRVSPPRDSSSKAKSSPAAENSSSAGGAGGEEEGDNESAQIITRMLFNLSAGERVLSDYSCAYVTKILLHGRMYVAEGRVCFYSNIFGYERKVVIRFLDMKRVYRERRSLVLETLCIETAKKTYAFCSFAVNMREDCAELCTELLRNTKRENRGRMRNRSFSGNDSPARRNRVQSGAAGSGPSPGPPVSPEMTGTRGRSPPPLSPAKSRGSGQGFAPPGTPEPAAPTLPPPPPEKGPVPANWKADFDDMAEVLNVELPITAQTLFRLFWADGAQYSMADHSKVLGESEQLLGSWQNKDPTFGMARLMRMRAPITGNPFGPSSTTVDKTQRYRFYTSGDVLVVEDSSAALDVPYGDYFTTEIRFLATPIDADDAGGASEAKGAAAEKDGAGGEAKSSSSGKGAANKMLVKVQVMFQCKFTKHTMWKSTIITKSMEACVESWKRWAEAAKPIAEAEAAKLAKGGGEDSPKPVSSRPPSDAEAPVPLTIRSRGLSPRGGQESTAALLSSPGTTSSTGTGSGSGAGVKMTDRQKLVELRKAYMTLHNQRIGDAQWCAAIGLVVLVVLVIAIGWHLTEKMTTRMDTLNEVLLRLEENIMLLRKDGAAALQLARGGGGECSSTNS